MNCKSFIFWGTLCLFSICQKNGFAEMVSIKGEDINMRSGPGTHYAVLYKLGSGLPLDVIERSGDWLKIRDFEGDAGWVHESTVCSKPYVIVMANKNSKSQINVRSGPGISNRIVAMAYYGVVFKKLGQEGQWVQVEHGPEVKGWIDSKLLWGF